MKIAVKDFIPLLRNVPLFFNVSSIPVTASEITGNKFRTFQGPSCSMHKSPPIRQKGES